MRRPRYTKNAQRDLTAVYDHVLDESGAPTTADKIVRNLRGKCSELAALPGTLGRSRPELGPDVRSFPWRSYVIFFRYEPHAFRVIAIVHGQRDIEALFDRG